MPDGFVAPLALSPDGRSLALASYTGAERPKAGQGGGVSFPRGWRVLRDGKQLGGVWPRVYGPFFNPRGDSVLFWGVSDKRTQTLIKDGVPVTDEYDAVSDTTTSHGGDRLIFAGIRNNVVYRVAIPW